jgi:hypothetical protein
METEAPGPVELNQHRRLLRFPKPCPSRHWDRADWTLTLSAFPVVISLSLRSFLSRASAPTSCFSAFNAKVDTRSRPVQRAFPHPHGDLKRREMSTTAIEVENQGVIEIRDPEIDVADVMRRIRQNMAVREKLPPLAAALGQARLFEERQKLRKAIEELHARVNNYGSVDTVRAGWRAKVELLVKKCIRKVLGRYIAQQQEVHGKLVETIYQLTGYLDQQDEVLCQRFDQCDRQVRDTAMLMRKGPISSASGDQLGEGCAA